MYVEHQGELDNFGARLSNPSKGNVEISSIDGSVKRRESGTFNPTKAKEIEQLKERLQNPPRSVDTDTLDQNKEAGEVGRQTGAVEGKTPTSAEASSSACCIIM